MKSILIDKQIFITIWNRIKIMHIKCMWNPQCKTTIQQNISWLFNFKNCLLEILNLICMEFIYISKTSYTIFQGFDDLQKYCYDTNLIYIDNRQN